MTITQIARATCDAGRCTSVLEIAAGVDPDTYLLEQSWLAVTVTAKPNGTPLEKLLCSKHRGALATLVSEPSLMPAVADQVAPETAKASKGSKDG